MSMTTTTVTGTGRRSSLSLRQPEWQLTSKASSSQSMTSPIDKFPPFSDETHNAAVDSGGAFLGSPARYQPNNYWEGRNMGASTWDHTNGSTKIPRTRPSRKSVSEAFRTIRARNTSVSANANELAQVLRAPLSCRLIVLCIVWYTTSATTNTSSKSILNALPQPVTLTTVQFGFVSTWCLFLTYLSKLFPSLKRKVPALKTGILYPSRDVILTALPLAIFQLAGHILSTMATSQIPVSLVHTIKGLSPLFTVLAYRIFFHIRYARATYLSLVPLTIGVMLACSNGVSTNFLGILYAFFATLVFVSQNIFSKRLFNEASRSETEVHTSGRRKLDKLNLLYYCSGLAFILTLPLWFVTEGHSLISDILRDGSISLSGKTGSLDHGALVIEFVFNGLSHFAQNFLAFVLLSMISPVSYSVASLVKRVFVIVAALLWFHSPTTSTQFLGIILTILGLYLYDRNSHDDLADQRANADHFRHGESVLPINAKTPSRPWDSNGYAFPPRKFIDEHRYDGLNSLANGEKKEDDEPGRNRPRGSSISRTWLPPGTKQESTWQLSDAYATH